MESIKYTGFAMRIKQYYKKGKITFRILSMQYSENLESTFALNSVGKLNGKEGLLLHIPFNSSRPGMDFIEVLRDIDAIFNTRDMRKPCDFIIRLN